MHRQSDKELASVAEGDVSYRSSSFQLLIASNRMYTYTVLINAHPPTLTHQQVRT
jgi:hypothetical protein